MCNCVCCSLSCVNTVILQRQLALKFNTLTRDALDILLTTTKQQEPMKSCNKTKQKEKEKEKEKEKQEKKKKKKNIAHKQIKWVNHSWMQHNLFICCGILFLMTSFFFLHPSSFFLISYPSAIVSFCVIHQFNFSFILGCILSATSSFLVKVFIHGFTFSRR